VFSVRVQRSLFGSVFAAATRPPDRTEREREHEPRRENPEG
jgi:hypothetical protein